MPSDAGRQEPILSRCPNCSQLVREGPEGGYTCGPCNYTEESPQRVAERLRAHLARQAAIRAASRSAIRNAVRAEQRRAKRGGAAG